MPESGTRPPTPRQAFERYCYLNCITEPEVVAKLWAERCAREGTNGTPGGASRGR